MNPHREQDRSSPHPDEGARERLVLARKWAYRLSEVGFIPLPDDELEQELLGLLDSVCADVLEEPFDTARSRAVGARLVEIHCVGEGSVECTVAVLGRGLPALSVFRPLDRFAERIAVCVGTVACGYGEANRQRTFQQQENIQLSLLKAVRDAKWNLRESEARFDQVVTAAASGIVITDLDGTVVRVNGAIGEILGRSADELTGRTLFDVVHPDYGTILREDYAALLSGRRTRIKQTQRLLRDDGDFARVTLTASLLRDGDGEPSHFVTVVEDGTELVLLQNEISRQALHDVLTGLPNRQFFGSHLESALQRADPRYGVTLFHLDLDAFSVVGNGLGRHAAQRLLAGVGRRLKSVVAREKAMVARFDSDEFGVLVENTASTPTVEATVAAIADALAEVTYVDGRGVALSAAVGVVHRPAPDEDPEELLRSADFALRQAKANGRGQWELYDGARAAQDQRAHAMAASMPGAWESGELSVRYRPLARLSDGHVAGVEAVLGWNHPELGPLSHARCVELAEHTGLMLPLGAWLLTTATNQVRWWHRRQVDSPPLLVGLTATQSADAGLLARVRAALDESGVSPDRLLLGIPAESMVAGRVQANVVALADLGVGVVVDGATPGDLAMIEDLPVRAVRVARELVERQARSPESAVATALAIVPALARQAGVAVIVDGVDTADQAQWWRLAGADTALGTHFGTPTPTLPTPN